MIRYIGTALVCLIVLMTAAWGVFMLFASPTRLINTAKRVPFGKMLRFPEEGTGSWKLLIGFYRFLGVLGLSICAFIIVMCILQLT